MDTNIYNDLRNILGEDKINVHLNEDYDIPLYKRNKFKKILVLSGGGIKGISHIGALKALEELGYLDKFETFAGTSVGALIIGLYVIGYKPDELLEFISKFDLSLMKSINVLNILDNFGLDCGIKIDYVVRRLIVAKKIDPDITLSDLYDITKKKLIFTTVCLNTVSTEYLSHEDYPNLSFYKAIRMSFAIPWMYTPVEYNNKLYVDGGCIDHYPIDLFKDKIDDVLGIYLTDINDIIDKIDNIETYTFRVFQCFMEGVNINSKKGYENCTILVNLKPISIVAYGLDKKEKEGIYKIGYDSVYQFFSKTHLYS